jgi:hypothetical protein
MDLRARPILECRPASSAPAEGPKATVQIAPFFVIKASGFSGNWIMWQYFLLERILLLEEVCRGCTMTTSDTSSVRVHYNKKKQRGTSQFCCQQASRQRINRKCTIAWNICNKIPAKRLRIKTCVCIECEPKVNVKAVNFVLGQLREDENNAKYY